MEDQGKRVVEIFVREKERFVRFVRRQILHLSQADAEDIVQEVAYSLLRQANVANEVENLTAYIFRSLANRVTDFRRRRRELPLFDEEETSENIGFDPADPRPGPDQNFQQRELREQLITAIGSLNPRERAVWVATEIDGRSFRELAEAWNEPVGTLLSRKSRANQALRKRLSNYRNPEQELK